MSWFDTPDSWWHKDKMEPTDFYISYAEDLWNLNRDNVPEEYHWPDRLRASFTIRVRNLISLGFQVREEAYFLLPPHHAQLSDEMLEGYSVVDGLHELVCVDVEFPITYSADLVFPVDFSLYPSYKYTLMVSAYAEAYYDPGYSITEAEIHNIQFWSVSPSAFWHKFVNTYETAV